jgi:DNA-binding CsgD family transcriptional regulator
MANTSPFSPREEQVLRFFVEGFTTEQIAARVGASIRTVAQDLIDIRRTMSVLTNEQAVLIAYRKYPHVLAGCVVRHGNNKAVDWHEDNEIPLCDACSAFQDRSPRPQGARTSSRAYRRLSATRLARSAPVECGTIQAARRHIRVGDKIKEVTCGCREAYQEWWREYQQARTGDIREAA